jgi:hypothetical protein
MARGSCLEKAKEGLAKTKKRLGGEAEALVKNCLCGHLLWNYFNGIKDA